MVDYMLSRLAQGSGMEIGTGWSMLMPASDFGLRVWLVKAIDCVILHWPRLDCAILYYAISS